VFSIVDARCNHEAPTCFHAVTPSSGSALLLLAKVTVVKIANYGTSGCGDVAAYISGSLLVCVSLHFSEVVGTVLISILM